MQLEGIWNSGLSSIILLLSSPILSFLVFILTPSKGSEWASDYNKLAICFVAQLILYP